MWLGRTVKFLTKKQKNKAKRTRVQKQEETLDSSKR